ncbi:protein of unknown function [Pseudomonas sp. JV241A]|nr:protein of unknown function [Pseudomonas sp. JV241A]
MGLLCSPSLASQLPQRSCNHPLLWEPDLPAIEREAVVIRPTPDVLAVPDSSLASQLPQGWRLLLEQQAFHSALLDS